MQVDVCALLDRTQESEAEFIQDQWHRLQSFLGQAKTSKLIGKMRQEQTLFTLAEMSTENILIKCAEIIERQQTMQRIKRCLIQGLQQYSSVCILKQEELNKLTQQVSDYEKTFQLIKWHKINQYVNNLKLQKLQKPQKPQNSSIFSYIRLVDSALYHTKEKYRLRPTQILALLLFLRSPKKRMLLQILTGQGKSTTIACLAAILAIRGRTVDIVTTSTLLASRDVKEKKQFYTILGLIAEDNLENKQFGVKHCYTHRKIVYGTPHNFQVDILMHDYKKRGTRCDRSYDVLIVDEVDSMFIDQKGHQTLIGTTYPGFSELAYPMKLIWNKICKNPVFQQNSKIMIALAMGQNQVITCEVKVLLQKVVEDIRKQFNNEIIPYWRMTFIQESLDHWINSAIKAAFYYKENVDYTIKNKRIVPVDAKNTGELQHNVNWSNGLHQFLEIKHSLEVTTETMTSNFISNVGHFDRYTQLYGLTGTLGSAKAKQFLQNTYNAQLFKVPPFKERKLKCEPGKVLYDEPSWARAICHKIKQMVDQKRSVLVLCQSIKEVNRIQFTLQAAKVVTKRTQLLLQGTEKIDDRIDCEEILLATNLAGRGADLKITETLNKNGGLHVIIGFMPANSRVQMQGRGRAGRNGQDGSSQLLVNLKRYCDQYGVQYPSEIQFENTQKFNLRALCKSRNLVEAKSIEQDEKQVEEMRGKDKVFRLYCKAMNEIPDFQKNQAKQLALEQQWAIFLKKTSNRKLSQKELYIQAEQLCQELKENSENYYNPNHHIQRGFYALKNKNKQAAICCFKEAQSEKGTWPQLFGSLYQNTNQINLSNQKKESIQPIIQNLKLLQTAIQHQKEKLQGLQVLNTQNKLITEHLIQVVNNQDTIFKQKIQKNNKQIAGTLNITFQEPANNQIEEEEEPLHNVTISTGTARVLDRVSNQIANLISKYENLAKDQILQIQFEPINTILDSLDGDQQQNKHAIQKCRENGLKTIPQGVIKKKKQVAMWRRVLVFALGVVQLVAGAVLVATASGLLVPLGIAAIIQGVVFCYKSIFSSPQLNNLLKFMGLAVIRYAISLCFAGMSGIKQLAALGKGGVAVISMSMKSFLPKMMANSAGFVYNVAMNSLKGVGINILSRVVTGVGDYFLGEQQQQLNPIVIMKQNTQRIKAVVNQGVEEEKKLDFAADETIAKFQDTFQLLVKQSIAKLDKKLLTELKILPIPKKHIQIIIKGAINDDESLKHDSQRSIMALCIINELQSPNLAAKYAETIQLDKKIINCLEHIRKQSNFDLAVDQSMEILIQTSLKQMMTTKQNEAKALYQQIKQRKQENLKNDSRLIFQAEQSAIKQSQGICKALVAEFDKCFKVPLNPTQILKQLKSKDGVVECCLSSSVIDSMQFHPYVKAALKEIKYSDQSKTFEQSLEVAIFNTLGSFAIKQINSCYSCSKGSATRLAKIAAIIKGKA